MISYNKLWRRDSSTQAFGAEVHVELMNSKADSPRFVLPRQQNGCVGLLSSQHKWWTYTPRWQSEPQTSDPCDMERRGHRVQSLARCPTQEEERCTHNLSPLLVSSLFSPSPSLPLSPLPLPLLHLSLPLSPVSCFPISHPLSPYKHTSSSIPFSLSLTLSPE